MSCTLHRDAERDLGNAARFYRTRRLFPRNTICGGCRGSGRLQRNPGCPAAAPEPSFTPPFTLPSAVQQTGSQSDRAAHESCVGSTAAAGSAPHTHDFAARSPARGPRLLVPEHRRMSTPARVGWSAPSNPDAGVDRRDVYRGLPPNVNATHSASKAEEPSLRTLPEAPDRRCDAEC